MKINYTGPTTPTPPTTPVDPGTPAGYTETVYNSADQRLMAAPPTLVNPIVWTPTATDNQRTFPSDRDVRIVTPNVVDWKNGIVIVGGRNVTWIGGTVKFSQKYFSPTATGVTGGCKTNRVMFVRGNQSVDQPPRTVHIEGIKVLGPYTYEGWNIESGAETHLTVNYQNIYVERIEWRHPYDATKPNNIGTGHDGGDVFQPWSGPEFLNIDKVTATGLTYQGYWLQPVQYGHTIPKFYQIRRTDLTGVRGSDQSEPSNSQLFAFMGNSNLPSVTNRPLHDVYVDPGPGKGWSQVIKGSWGPGLFQGSPPNGSFVQPEDVGIGYVSPGYVGQ